MNNNIDDLPLLNLSPWERIQLHPSIILFSVLLLVVGVPGNIIILYVYTRRININICGFFIKTLAVLDLINFIGIILAFLISKIPPVVNPPLLCKYMTLFNTFSAVTAGVLYVVIAVQRHKKICRPQGSEFTKTFAKGLTCCCIIFSFVFCLPIFFILTNNEMFVELRSMNETGFVKVPICDFTETSKHMKLSLAFLSCLCLHLVCVSVSLLVFYSLIGRHSRKQTKQCHLNIFPLGNRWRNRASNLTKMFFSLAVIYLITVNSRVILAVYLSQTQKLPHLKMQHLQIFDFFAQLPYLNCVVNIFVYGFSSKCFRDELRLTICKTKKSTETPNRFRSASNVRVEATSSV